MRAINLKTEYMVNPLGIDIRRPYLSGNCSGGIKQTAYEIEAVSEGEFIWNSGKIISDKMNEILGVEAESRQRISWKVRLWDEQGAEGGWSEEACFEMGILDKKQFVAKWINPELTGESQRDSQWDPQAHKPASY